MRPLLDLDRINEELERKTPQEIIRWAHSTFGNRLGLLSSMQKTASVLTFMIFQEGLKNTEIIFVDTGYHFQETLDLRDRMIEKYGVNIKTYYPDTTPEQQFQQYGRELYLRDGDYQLCCKLRKEQPYLKAVNNFDAMLSGLMRSEGGARKSIRIVTEDPRTDTYKVHPLANWTVQDVKRFIEEYDILVHPLHSKGYPSIGCSTCTTPVAPNEDERAGRWRHIREANPNGPQKLYCGINFSDVNPSREEKSSEKTHHAPRSESENRTEENQKDNSCDFRNNASNAQNVRELVSSK